MLDDLIQSRHCGFIYLYLNVSLRLAYASRSSSVTNETPLLTKEAPVKQTLSRLPAHLFMKWRQATFQARPGGEDEVNPAAGSRYIYWSHENPRLLTVHANLMVAHR